MTVNRRAMLAQAGEQLLVSKSALEVVTREGDFIEATGLPTDAVLSTPLCSVPLPLYSLIPEGRRRWAGVRPEAMWHPLMWLPERLAYRYDVKIEGADDGFLESSEVWAVRMALELSISGLYDAETGQWVDVLSTVGLDVENPEHLERISAWLEGTPDEDLDAIDLSDYLDLPDREWALESALALIPELQPASWALMSNDLAALIDDAVAPDLDGTPADAETIKKITPIALNLASVLLAKTEVPGGHVPIPQFCDVMLSFADQMGHLDLETYTARVVSPIRDRLVWIRDSYWGYLGKVDAMLTEG